MRREFQCSSASRKFLNRGSRHRAGVLCEFQCSSASRKFLNHPAPLPRQRPHSFSALQRAENSSIGIIVYEVDCFEGFSALQRAENSSIPIPRTSADSPDASFSALQRAENSSMWLARGDVQLLNVRFQCSSASRKFLNESERCVSLQKHFVSVLFSEPKIPQCYAVRQARLVNQEVSVLFSEPKIPQFQRLRQYLHHRLGFSALQRAENSSMLGDAAAGSGASGFSALQRAENSSIPTLAPASIHISDRDDHASSFLSLPGASP